MNLYDRILGHPFVYDRIRPLVVGGIDLAPLYNALQATDDDVILDVGCGTGNALNYLHRFRQYWGFDIDDVAVSHARRTFANRTGAVFRTKLLDANDLRTLDPTCVVMGGLLHHLATPDVMALLGMLRRSLNLRRAVTQDIVYLPGKPVSNFFARLDRGRHCRSRDGYETLAKDAGFRLVSSSIVPSHPTRGRVQYLIMTLEP